MQVGTIRSVPTLRGVQLPHRPEATTQDRFESSSPSLRQAFEGIVHPSSQAKVTLLSDNIEAWNARWKLTESAQQSIHAQYYTWDHDIFGMAQLGQIFHKARQGVEVRLMVDAVGDTFGTRGFKSHRGGKDFLQEVVALPSAEAKVYHPHYKKIASALLNPTGLEGIAANHDKILEVDGKAASVGGRNTGHHYFLHAKDDPKAWRDVDVLVRGEEVASELRQAVDEEFDKGWIHHTVQPDLLGNWKKRDAELLGAHAMMDLWLKAPVPSDSEKAQLREQESVREERAQDLVVQATSRLRGEGFDRKLSGREQKALQEMALELVAYPELCGSYHKKAGREIEAQVKVVDSHSAVGAGRNEINQALLGLIAGAQERIRIQTPYYVLTDPVIDALQKAGERGVDIQIATNSPSNTDSFFTQVFFLNDWKKSLATIPNLDLYAATGERKHHAKMALFDEDVAVVGTYNLDLVSAEVNGEVGAVMWSKEMVKEVDRSMDQDFSDPTLGFVQYEIARNPAGQAVDAAGNRVLDDQGNLIGEPQRVFGPEEHVDPEVLAKYDKKIRRWNWSRKHLPQFESLRRFV